MSVPELRFPEFEGEWEEKKLNDLAIVNDGTHFTPKYQEEGIPFFSVDTIVNDAKPKYISLEDHDKLIKRCKPEKGDILVSRISSGTLGQSKLVDWNYDFSIYVSLALIKPKNSINSSFLNQYFKSNNYQRDFMSKSLQLATPMKINIIDLKKTNLNIPSLEEQEKTASFLSVVDEKIEKLEEKQVLWEAYKKGMMQKIFSQELRFKDENGEDYPGWEETNLGSVLIEINEKATINNQFEILSSTKENIVLQKDYFDRVIASKNNKGYKILRKNQLVLSPQNLWLGNINVNDKYEVGIVSPSYKIYQTTDKILINYLKFIIKTPRMLYEYKIASEQGASVVRRNLNKELFNNIPLLLPSIHEQKNISSLLSLIEKKIDEIKKELNFHKKFKKGLLQKMFC